MSCWAPRFQKTILPKQNAIQMWGKMCGKQKQLYICLGALSLSITLIDFDTLRIFVITGFSVITGTNWGLRPNFPPQWRWPWSGIQRPCLFVLVVSCDCSVVVWVISLRTPLLCYALTHIPERLWLNFKHTHILQSIWFIWFKIDTVWYVRRNTDGRQVWHNLYNL